MSLGNTNKKNVLSHIKKFHNIFLYLRLFFSFCLIVIIDYSS